MKKNLLLSMAALVLAANVVAAPFGKIVAKDVNNNGISKSNVLKPAQNKAKHTPLQKAAAADDTQVYLEDFEDYYLDSSNRPLPNDWVVTDDNMGLTNERAKSGMLSLVSGYDPAKPRNAWAFSEPIEMKAGQTYHVGIWVFAYGWNSVMDEWKITAGTAAEETAQTNIIIDKTGSNKISNETFELFTGTFTPATDGTYYIGINHCTSVPDVNAVYFDYLQVDTDHVKILPEGFLFSTGGLWSMDILFADENGNPLIPTVYINEHTPLRYGCVGQHIESIAWEFDDNTTVTEEETLTTLVHYSFPEDSIYHEAILIMSNADGDSYAGRSYITKNLYCDNAGGSGFPYLDCVANIKPEDGFNIYAGGGNEYTAMIGLNGNYQKIAERYSMPDGIRSDMAGLYIVYAAYKMSMVHRTKPLTINVKEADENGMPGETVYSITKKLNEVFSTSVSIDQAQLALAVVEFDELVSVTGTYFIEFEFPAVTPGSQNYIFLVTSSVRLWDDVSTYIYNPTEMEGYAEGYYNTAQIYGANISTAIYPMIQFGTSNVITNKINGGCAVYANGNEINLVNATIGSDVVVTDIAGRTVLVEKIGESKATIKTNLNRGIYIVTVDGKSTKVAIR